MFNPPNSASTTITKYTNAVVKTAAVLKNPNTNLTRTQEALLSPEEQIIAKGKRKNIMIKQI